MGLTPEQKKVADLMKKQSKGSFKDARHKDPVVGGSLPGGIVGGVAKFTDYVFKIQEGTNKVTVNLIGTVVRPVEFAGLRASKMHFLSESEYNTIEEAYADFYGDLQLLGIDTRDDDHEDLAAIFADLDELKEEERLFKFNTSRSNKANARTRVWLQGLPDEEELAEIEAEMGSDVQVDDEADDDESDEIEEPETGDDDAGDDSPPEDPADDEEQEEEEWIPAVKEIYSYRPNPKTKPQNCVVTKVLKSKMTVDLKRVKDGQTYTAVPWAKLEGEIE
jgi:hypothetical protein